MFSVTMLLCSCSQSEDIIAGGGSDNADGLVPINIGVTSLKTLTRGTGTVGAVGGDQGKNYWNAEKINVFMVKKNTTEIAEFDDGTTKTTIFDNAVFTTPSNDQDPENILAVAEAGVKYYPGQNNFDFWGYRLDGAQLPDENGDDYTKTDEEISIRFAIDGSQDVMVAKADLNDEQKEDFARQDGVGEAKKDNYYSAFAARHGVQPTLNFKHLLTRLTFNVKAGKEEVVDNNVEVVGIRVKSKYTGKLVAVYTGNTYDEGQIVFDEDMENLSLQQRDENSDNLKALEPVAVTYSEDVNAPGLSVGEALLVAPQDDYEIQIVLQQPNKTNSEKVPYTYTMKKVTTDSKLPFVAGTSYNITFIVYGLQEVKVTTTLEPWKEGDTIAPITPEDEDEN